MPPAAVTALVFTTIIVYGLLSGSHEEEATKWMTKYISDHLKGNKKHYPGKSPSS